MDDSRASTRPDEIGMTEADYAVFEDYFYRKTGIHLTSAKRYFVTKRLAKRIAASGLGDFRAYFAKLRLEASQREFQALVNEMTVNETYFFREEHQFRCLVASILPEITARRPGRPLKIWSTPCSTGEEPYSIAIYLLEHWPGLAQHDVTLIASDIDTDVLAAARRGSYAERAFQNLPAAIRARHFDPPRNGLSRISEQLLESVEFLKVNLIAPPPRLQAQDIDVVFCRNLLIYFDQAAQRQAVEAIATALRPGGFVLLGHSESMSRISSLFAVRRFADGIVYQKPLEGPDHGA
ncbi:protein-glutamate O-methyltransferase CheR [Rhodobacter sp. Har01]|uniref:CheR family methyltransferase n=1 Tax=Rhodobacter sp. Har01 TaxID=2883999 RepID=UPI001D0904FC|nr:protein-glutamate O-methyltransferase CheR [Rhodobacter sp. Har01]MCB6179269.1 protein-glutamate O-methyltransferase CheR [Rhodobacter sp. Har01]